MKQVTFHEDARAELAEASHYYEDCISGLGQALIDDVEKTASEILAHPKACKLISKNLRRKVLRRFPYSLIYVVETDRVRIMAVAHHKRRPEYWRYRLA
ncbi:type II toxin-antitoxin system RelE/ParE family toxin [Geobacter argillaceus]|uniref:ParE-like toxin of type II ParDE toxin-antitoxin system n=1 Tax=Geobacter argillaceus TaxID=345631 RepID=A0A562VI86_9BACT|nr:type II toxin-antitoxin system RelE/ParE family toxin [Geobacter argillaceus]TWJ17548.1 ParE-like toxin of type II ParDE toxin-antitoxin system [Geobacter argillaceus]